MAATFGFAADGVEYSRSKAYYLTSSGSTNIPSDLTVEGNLTVNGATHLVGPVATDSNVTVNGTSGGDVRSVSVLTDQVVGPLLSFVSNSGSLPDQGAGLAFTRDDTVGHFVMGAGLTVPSLSAPESLTHQFVNLNGSGPSVPQIQQAYYTGTTLSILYTSGGYGGKGLSIILPADYVTANSKYVGKNLYQLYAGIANGNDLTITLWVGAETTGTNLGSSQIVFGAGSTSVYQTATIVPYSGRTVLPTYSGVIESLIQGGDNSISYFGTT